MTELLNLLTWASPAFPTGGYAYSHGIEWAVEVGDVRDAGMAETWIGDILTYGAGRSDAILLRHAYRGALVSELASALAGCAERRLETQAQGAAFAAAARAGWGEIADAPYPVAFGMLAARHRAGEDDALRAFLHAFTSNLVSAAVRLVPLGQSAGLGIVARLADRIETMVVETRTAELGDIGQCCFRSDVAAMRHEAQYTRLFRT